MTATPDAPQSYEARNEDVYDQLVTVIEVSEGTLAPVIAVCDDRRLRERIIQRYEAELSPKFRAYRLKLNTHEPSLRASLSQWMSQPDAPKPGESAVVSVTGAEELLWVHLQGNSTEQTELEKFFGYLQWTREGLQEFPYPIVLWITNRILKVLSRQAPDFWSWRRAVFRFESEPAVPQIINREAILLPVQMPQSEKHLLPLEDLSAQIALLEAREGLQAPGLATLYHSAGQIYADRVQQGTSKDIPHESAQAIELFKKAIDLQTTRGLDFARIYTLVNLGVVYFKLSNYSQAIDVCQEALQIARRFSDLVSEGIVLSNLGNVYVALGQYHRAINFHRQALKIAEEVGDQLGEGTALGSLGNSYYSIGQYQQAIDCYQRYLAIARTVSNCRDEGNALGSLGNVYAALGEFDRAINLQHLALDIFRQIGDRQGESATLGNLGNSHQSLGKYSQALSFYQQQLAIARGIGDRQYEAAGLLNIGNTNISLEQGSEALENIQPALRIFHEIGDRPNEAEAYLTLAKLYQAQGQLEQARETCDRALTIATELGIPLKQECEALQHELVQGEPKAHKS